MKKTKLQWAEELTNMKEVHAVGRLQRKKERLTSLGLYEDVIEHIDKRVKRLKKRLGKERALRAILYKEDP